MTPGAVFDSTMADGYAANLSRFVPGLEVMHRIVDQILAESVPADGRVLLLGAGGGAELAYLAARRPDWRLDGVDPSRPMLEEARRVLGDDARHVNLVEGYVDDAPPGPYDGATSLLTLHFLDRTERVRTLREMHRRMRPGAPLLTFHHSVPVESRDRWFQRAWRFAAGPEASDQEVAASAAALARWLPVLTPGEDESVLAEAGFADPAQCYSALTLRGWVSYA